MSAFGPLLRIGVAASLTVLAVDRAPATAGGPQGRVGQFVVECRWSHSSFDDPIVLPTQPGASHRHDFFGNTATAADSTYDGLVTAPTTCQQRFDTAAYWAPSLLTANGTPVLPRRATAYYRAGVEVDPATVQAYPPGLMMVAGGSTTAPQAMAGWSCRAGTMWEPVPQACAATVGLRVSIRFPDCWDGEHVDTADHRAHVAYSTAGGCPPTHPVSIPQLEIVVDYGRVVADGLTLSSGEVTGAHADFWNTWDQDKLETEVESCLRRQQVCSVSSG